MAMKESTWKSGEPLDHVPENCAPENLRHWCQRCHLNYDVKHHAQTAAATRRAKANTLEMF